MRLSLPVTLLASIAISLATRASAQAPALWLATVERRIGGPEIAGEAFIFSDVRGLAVHPDGRVFVADNKDHNIRVFSPAGVHLETIGQRGQGPSDFNGPCCLAFGADGHLWVQDFGNKRYTAFDVSTTPFTYVRSVRGGPNPVGTFTPLSWAPRGELLDIQSAFDAASGEFRQLRVRLDSLGRTITVDTIEHPDPRLIAEYRHRQASGSAVYAQPFGSRALYAFGPRGEMAVATSGAYSVKWLDIEGRLLRTLTARATPPELSAAERESARSAIESVSKRVGRTPAQMSFSVPDRKPVLAALGFDAEGRLWVRRSSAQRAPNVADVYDAHGRLVARATWPANIRLYLYTVRGRDGWGMETQPDETINLARLRFQ